MSFLSYSENAQSFTLNIAGAMRMRLIYDIYGMYNISLRMLTGHENNNCTM